MSEHTPADARDPRAARVGDPPGGGVIHEREITDASQGRIGADRMALGLSSVPDTRCGDMEAVRALLDRIAELEAALDALREAALAVLRAFGENDASNAVGLAVGEQVDMLRAALGEGE